MSGTALSRPRVGIGIGEIGRGRLGGPGPADGGRCWRLRTTPACMRRGTWTATARPTIRGTSGRRQYPALSLDVDSDGRASWQEMGRQLRAGPALTAAAVGPARVDLTCIGSVHMMELRAAVTALQ